MEKLVVVVDNSGPVREVLLDAISKLRQEMLAAGTLLVETCESGERLLELCTSRAPDLIILDVNMPGLDGIETFYKLREARPELASRVVFLTGYAGSEEVTKRLDQAVVDGARGVLPKPVGVADLDKLLDRHLR